MNQMNHDAQAIEYKKFTSRRKKNCKINAATAIQIFLTALVN